MVWTTEGVSSAGDLLLLLDAVRGYAVFRHLVASKFAVIRSDRCPRGGSRTAT